MILDSQSGWIDISIPVHNDMMLWPRDPKVCIQRTRDIAKGDSSTVSSISMSTHTGTHIDAPYHFFTKGKRIDEVSFDTVIGPARVIDIQDTESIKQEVLSASGIQPGERILFKTCNSKRCWKAPAFVENYVYLSTKAAEFLAETQVKMIGIDSLSVGGFRVNNRAQVHKTLLGAGVWIIECLDLTAVKAGYYDLICLPLKLREADAAPARAIVRPLQSSE